VKPFSTLALTIAGLLAIPLLEERRPLAFDTDAKSMTLK